MVAPGYAQFIQHATPMLSIFRRAQSIYRNLGATQIIATHLSPLHLLDSLWKYIFFSSQAFSQLRTPKASLRHVKTSGVLTARARSYRFNTNVGVLTTSPSGLDSATPVCPLVLSLWLLLSLEFPIIIMLSPTVLIACKRYVNRNPIRFGLVLHWIFWRGSWDRIG